MFNNIVNNALSGINAAQGGLNVVSNNLANSSVPWYHRQTAVFGENPGSMTANGYLGNGAYISNVRREYDEFVSRQYNGAVARSGDLTSYAKNCDSVDNLLSNSVDDISGSIGDFFSAMDSIASDASDSSIIDVFLGKAKSLVQQMKEADRQLREMEKDVNQQISNKADQINGYTDKIADLNDKISRARAVNGAEPNDLLDQRDRLVTELNSLVGVKVVEQNGNYNVSFANGLPLVTGSKASRLEAVASSADDSKLTIGFSNGGTGAVREINEKLIKGGELSGIFRSRTEVIEPTRRKLNQLALVLADKFNEAHHKGFDVNGQPGGDFFSYGKGSYSKNAHNKGDANFTIDYTDTGKVTGSDYEITSKNGAWEVLRLPDRTPVTVTQNTAGELEFDGMKISINQNTMQDGDRIVLKSVDDVIGGMDALITDSSKFANAGAPDGGVSDNDNIKALMKLQDEKLMGNKATFSDFYASLVNEVGSKTNQAQLDLDTQNAMTDGFFQAEQAVSGVNMNEEHVQMQKMSQFFSANAKMLQTTTVMFDTLLRTV